MKKLFWRVVCWIDCLDHHLGGPYTNLEARFCIWAWKGAGTVVPNPEEWDW